MSNAKDTVGVYLKEIGRIPLLTATEEINLARQIQDLLKIEASGNRLRDLRRRSPTNAELAMDIGISVQQLRHRRESGRFAKNKMIRANLRLVVSIAKKYLNRGLTLLDLIQEGSLGLIRATEKFDPELGYKFSTYASWWIKQSITRAIEQKSRNIRLPAQIYQSVNRFKKTRKTLTQTLGRTPKIVEIAAAMEIDLDKLRLILDSAMEIDSIDRLVGKEEKTPLAELIPAANLPIETTLVQNCRTEAVNGILNNLSAKETEVMRSRYGFDNGQMRSREEVGQILNLSKERVRQIETRALRKLRHPTNSKVLREYLI